MSFDQKIEPAFRHFIIIASDYSKLYGNPLKVILYTSVVTSGEKSAGDVLAQRLKLHGRQIGAVPRQRTTLYDLAGQ